MSEIFTGADCDKTDARPPLPINPQPTMAYIPFQEWGDTYDSLKALDQGTLFPALDKPFYGERGEPR